MDNEADVIPLENARGASSGGRRCRATAASGRPCRNYAVHGSDLCRIHLTRRRRTRSDRTERTAPSVTGRRTRDRTDGDLAQHETGLLGRRLSGDYEVDDFGYDEQLLRAVLMPAFRPLYERYFRVRAVGVERIPTRGPALLVANHSGTVPLDAVVMQHAVASEHPHGRIVRHLAADLIFRVPFAGALARKSGVALACEEDALELLRRGELVGVFPEGYKGTGKGWLDRYRLQRFGRGGFAEMALKARAPIVPVAIVGAEEAYPMIADLKPLARALRLPYFPVTPTFPWLGLLGLVPLPSKWRLEFGAPIPVDEYPQGAHEDAMMVFDLADRVRDTVQQMVNRNLAARGSAFL
ncbi:MAG TPA: lysophospholipid acyltransferase family protein [Actinomycetota bacterium]|nr:lysophospholipid acyltransferase family protein [Actinomycetota bacterium]